MSDNPYDNLGSGISSITVQNLQDETVQLESLWTDRRVVLVFLRHFG